MIEEKVCSDAVRLYVEISGRIDSAIEEAIRIVVNESLPQYSAEVSVNPRKLAIALSKQKAVDPLEVERGYLCPVCMWTLHYEHQDYCDCCGQKIDWEEQKKEKEEKTDD